MLYVQYCVRQDSDSNNPQILVTIPKASKICFSLLLGPDGEAGLLCKSLLEAVTVFAGGRSKRKADRKELCSGSQGFCSEVTQGTAVS